MVVEYEDSPTAQELQESAREFMETEVLPVEREYLGEAEVPMDVIEDLFETAKEYGVFCPQIEEEYGGGGYDFRDVLPLFEEAGRSVLGQMAMRVDAPDEGNMHTLELVGTEEQKEKWLKPLVQGEIRSGFSMTEPRDGAGSDPKMMRTTAEKDGDEWVINGHKWWTTQGVEADVLLVMARTDMDAHPYEGTSIILVPADADGVEIVNSTPHIGQSLVPESHAEIRYDNVRVPEENLLGAENAGFMIAQQRLGPARLTHCMRFSGMADRALGIAKAYMSEREAFDENLSEKQAQRFELAERETQLHAARTMVRHAAEKIAQGEEARIEVAMSKYFTANVVQDTIDFAVQACGGAGISRHLPLADFYEANRAFRIVDGADEVHKRSIARAAFEDVPEGELTNLPQF
ncbi:acyl-CoA dehydrogenase family protein [Halorientalis salina]|uniref:acyl-CoA dehydrogenase family protein n=1 Tax=Halorientalis salina TaxID=2932266 RepID=UPI0010AB8E74|nr:acyl-CoA dehydrogenase family protein [Halorientalis salina]